MYAILIPIEADEAKWFTELFELMETHDDGRLRVFYTLEEAQEYNERMDLDGRPIRLITYE